MRLSKFIVLVGIILALVSQVVLADTASAELSQLLPDRVGKFTRVSTPIPAEALKDQGVLHPNGYLSLSAGQAEYTNGKDRFLLEVVKSKQDVEAYGLLTIVSATERQKQPGLELTTDKGTAGFAFGDHIAFFRGLHFVRVTSLTPGHDAAALTAFAQSVSDSLDKGEGEIPVLVKHLPSADEAQKTAVYLTRFVNIQTLVPQQLVLAAIDAGGNADAVLATVGSSKVLIVEFNTPQLATDNDQRIIARIHELWKLGQVAPTAYRRVGNYSVFVFDAPDEQTAKQLIDQVKYEQVVQWLGGKPKHPQRGTTSLRQHYSWRFIAVVKASGFALVGCLGLGGLIGAFVSAQTITAANCRSVLRRRRHATTKPRRSNQTPTTNPSRLLRDRN